MFEGDGQPSQRPSWNYRKEDGGGIVSDMLCHWRYVIDNLFGEVSSVSSLCATHIPGRWDEKGRPYRCTADDAAYSTLGTRERRHRRHQQLLVHAGAARRPAHAAGRRHRRFRRRGPARLLGPVRRGTPRAVWNPDIGQPIRFLEGWRKLPGGGECANAFKAQWELFLRHVVDDAPFRWTLLEGAKGVQLAEKALESSKLRAWVDVGPLA